MKNFFAIICLIFIFFFSCGKSCGAPIQGGISKLESVPTELYGTWEVGSVQTYTNNPKYNAPPWVDYWNIYRHGDVLTLENPQSDVRSSVTVNSVKNGTISFTRKSVSKDEETTETPIITISGEDFWGTDKMVMKKYKNGALIQTDVVEFSIRGKKIGGASVSRIFN